jgi:hypothetical protein
MVNAVELTALLLFLDRCGAAVPADRLRLFQHASEAHIGRLVERIGAATRRRLDPLVESDMRFAIDYVSDYPGDCGPTLPALAARAVRWHVRPARRMVEDVLPPGINLTRPTPLPPFPLRKTPGVTFLDTGGAIVAEADSMGHCIASWTARALRGECFLFHVVRHGERASVAVDARGRVLQAAGPRNSANEAMRWGARLLRKWAMAGEAPRPRRRRPALTATQLALPFV